MEDLTEEDDVYDLCQIGPSEGEAREADADARCQQRAPLGASPPPHARGRRATTSDLDSLPMVYVDASSKKKDVGRGGAE